VDPRRAVPAVDRVAAALATRPGLRLGPALLTQCARDAVDQARSDAALGVAIELDAVVDDAAARAVALEQSLLHRVINATGVIVHTNLGRSPLGDAAFDAARGVATGYSNLEYQLDAGGRGSRHEHAGALLARACGAEAGIVVNNNAAAVLLALGALARGQEVVVSRGELVEIGGGFRVPEIMAESGCRLVEVGTTNRTRIDDYRAQVCAETALLLKVHASNYRMVGFTEATTVAELAELGPPVMVDAGSGLLDDTTPWLPSRPAWLHDEPGVRQALEQGAAIVTFSGDKLLGGPQAGIVVGRADLVAAIAGLPLARAVRADKTTLASLQAVALQYLEGDVSGIPLWRMATIPVEALRERCAALALALPGAEVIDTESVAGGGTLPGLTIPSVGVAITVRSVDAALARLRDANVVARALDARVVADLRTVDAADDAALVDALRSVIP
jgi:L-seryl-tRNA(Ser) seleniumtransferase